MRTSSSDVATVKCSRAHANPTAASLRLRVRSSGGTVRRRASVVRVRVDDDVDAVFDDAGYVTCRLVLQFISKKHVFRNFKIAKLLLHFSKKFKIAKLFFTFFQEISR